jgi:acetyl-CoA carboxylase biotin carboxyl carrier protein
MELKPGELQEILKVFVESEIRDLQLQVGDIMLSVSKNETGAAPIPMSPSAPAVAPPAGKVGTESPVTPPEVRDGAGPVESSPDATIDRTGLHELRAPLVGIFYRRPGPDQPPYVEVGDEVRVGDPVCTISVMKMFTEVGADRAGRVVEICVANETLVEHGEVLMYIDPADSS